MSEGKRLQCNSVFKGLQTAQCCIPVQHSPALGTPQPLLPHEMNQGITALQAAIKVKMDVLWGQAHRPVYVVPYPCRNIT